MGIQASATVPADFIRSGYNATGSTISKKRFVIRTGAAPHNVTLPPAAAGDVGYGVTLEDIPDLSYGGVQVLGKAVVTSGAAVTVGARVMADNAGKAIDWTAAGGANAAVYGVAVSGTVGADEDVEIELLGPGGSRQG
jgi:hypothetical protein